MSVRLNNVLIGNECYPNNERIFKTIDLDFVGSNEVDTITMNYETDADIFKVAMCKKYLDSLGKPVTLCMFYMPYSRMDREIDGYMFSLKYFCQIINSLNFYMVQILDPHSDVAAETLNRCHILTPKQYISNAIRNENPDYILCPDVGAYKRYKELYLDKEVPMFYAMKKRNLQTGQIISYDLVDAPDLTDKTVLIVDDLCSKGRTFLEAGRLLKNAGAKKVVLYITHCENSIYKGELLGTDYIDHIYTTNSILPRSEHKKITVFNI